MRNFFHHFFTPSHKNNFRAKGLHLDVLTGYVVVALCLTMLNSRPVKKVLGVAIDITSQRLYELTNQERAKAGLPALSYNATLSNAAQLKAADMFSKNYWAHNAPDGTTPWVFFQRAGYRYELAGENLARDFEYSNNVMDGWMASPGHKENILKSGYTDIGFAVANGQLDGTDTTLVVQLFGKPIDGAAPAKIVATSQTTTKTVDAPNKPSIVPSTKPTDIPQVSKKPEGEVASIKQPTEKSLLAALSATSAEVKVSPFAQIYHLFTTNIAFLAVVALALALILDLYYAYQLEMLRLGGKNLAHLLFLITAVVGYMIISKGSIL